MATTLPQFQRRIDNAFTQTWYEMQRSATDNILQATVVWALLKMKGCFKSQEGGDNISRTVKYAIPPTQAVKKGSVMNDGETETRTAGFWTFRNIAANIQRNLFDDTANRGKFKLIDYVQDRLEDATDSLKQQYELDVLRTETTDESGDNIQSLNDMVPTFPNAAVGTYGNIARANDWWQPKYQQFDANKEVNLVSNMNTFFNTVSNNQESPDIILCTKTDYEIYTDFGLDAVQIVGNQKLLDMGFQTVKFMGQEMTWTPNVASGDMMFLNSRWIECVYDPILWFAMTDWKSLAKQFDRFAQIVCRMNIVSKQLRRHGRLYD